MCAAAIGNIVSDVAGILMGTAIEDFCAKYLNLPNPNLTNAQRQLRSVRFANQFGCAVGIVVGCVIGMFPLLYIDSNKIQARKREAHLDSMFRDVITEAGSLIGAQRTCMYLVVDDPNDEDQQKQQQQQGGGGGDTQEKQVQPQHPPKRWGGKKRRQPIPKPDGTYLYAKYDADADGNTFQSDRQFPLGRGIVSRAALTGEAWNIYDVRSEPDFAPETGEDDNQQGFRQSEIRNMVCVPVLDAQGRAIAVLQALNKVSRGRVGMGSDGREEAAVDVMAAEEGFASRDVNVLKALASHISVSLQRMYDEAGEESDMRLRDTITMLKDYGLQGLPADGASTEGKRSLFPED